MPGLRAQSKIFYKVCPFCGEKLSAIEYMQRMGMHICRCKNCRKLIDERNVRY